MTQTELDLLKRVEVLTKHRDVLLKALEFYANDENWMEHDTGIGPSPADAVDYGVTAKEAIEAIK